MDSNYDKIKKLMQESNTQLPSEMDWENMKGGIFEKMQSMQPEITTQSKNRSNKRIAFIFALFCASTLSVFFISQYVSSKNNETLANQDTQTTNTDLLSNVPEEEQQLTSMKMELENRTSTNRMIASNNSKLEHLGFVQKGKKERLSQRKLGADNRKNYSLTSIDQKMQNTDVSLKLSSIDKSVFMKNESPTNQSRVVGSSFNQSVQYDKTKSRSENQRISFIQKKYSDFKEQENANLPMIDNHREDQAQNQPENKRIDFSNQISLSAGLVIWDEGYGSNKPDRAEYESTLASWLVQSTYSRRFGKNLFFMTGLQYLQLESMFDYNNTIQDYPITLKDTIIQVQNNLITGEQILVRGDVELSVQADQRIRHYNRISLIQAPITMGKSWLFNSFQTDVYLGGSLNILSQNEGRTYYDDMLIDYKGTSNTIIHNQWTVDAIIGGRIHYFIDQNIGVHTGFQVQKSIMNWSKENQMDMYPVSFNWYLGASIRF